jgi:hypothetical protein
MPTQEPLRQLAATQLGLISREQAARLGFGSNRVAELVASGRWRLVSDRVLILDGAPATRGQRALLGVLDAGGDAVLSHGTAAAWWGAPGFALVDVHVVRSTNPSRVSSASTMHRVRLLPPTWVTVHRSIPIVRPELCVLQLCATEHLTRAERALDNFWRLRLLSGPSLLAFIAQLGKRGRDGTAGMRQLIDARGPDYVPPASNLESRFDRILEEHGLPSMRHEIDSGGATWTGRVDRRSKDLPLIVEIQSETYHAALVDSEADALRLAQLRTDGFVVVEVTDAMVWQRPDEVARVVRDARSGLRRRSVS